MQIGSKKWKNVIFDGAKDLEIQIDQGKIDQFGIHASELLKWTRKDQPDCHFRSFGDCGKTFSGFHSTGPDYSSGCLFA